MILEDIPAAPWVTQIIAQALAMLVAIGGGFRWVLTWAFKAQETARQEFLAEMRAERAAHGEEIKTLYANMEKLAEILRDRNP